MSKFAKETSVDNEKVKSILRQSYDKYLAYNEIKPNKNLICVQYVLVYDYLRETLEAIAFKKGWKINNHICYVPFLKEICQEEEFAERFDRFRFIRNGIQYYAKDLSSVEGEKLINQMLDLVDKLKRKYFNE
jgi:hypothetical protein